MPGDKETIEQFAARIKAKYPQYKDVDNATLAQKIIAKYPEYSSKVDMGVTKPATTTTSTPVPEYVPPNFLAPKQEVPAPAAQLPQPTPFDQAGERLGKVLQVPDTRISNLLDKEFKQSQAGVYGTHEAGQLEAKQQEAMTHLMKKFSGDNSDIEALKQDLPHDINLQRKVIEQDATQQDKSDLYLMDAQHRATPEKKATVLKNADDIANGKLDYVHGKLVKPQGFLSSLVHGHQTRNQEIDEAELYMKQDDAANKKLLDEQEKNYDPDKPQPVPAGALANIGEMTGGNAIPMLKGAAMQLGATALANPEAGPWLAAAINTPEYAGRAFINSLKQNYYELKHTEGISEEEAFTEAKKRAAFDAAAAGAQGAIQTYSGAKILGGARPQPINFSKGFEGVMKGVLKGAEQFGKQTITSGLPNAAIVGQLEVAKNAYAGREESTNVLPAMSAQLMFEAGLGLLAKGFKGVVDLTKGKKTQVVQNIAKQSPELIQEGLGKLVDDGTITPKEAETAVKTIEAHKEADSKIPEQVTDDKMRSKIADKMAMYDQLKARLETAHESLHPELKERLKTLEAEITQMSAPTPKEKVELTPEQEFEQKAKDLIQEGIDKPVGEKGHIPGVYYEFTKEPKKFIEYIQQELKQGNEEMLRESFGDKLVDFAQENVKNEKPKVTVSTPIIRNVKLKENVPVVEGEAPAVPPTEKPEQEGYRPNFVFGEEATGKTEADAASNPSASQPETTGITHDQMDETAKEFGLETYQEAPETIKQWDAQADERFAKDPEAMNKVLNKMRNGGQPDAVEQRMMIKYVADLKAKIRKTPTDELLIQLKRAKDLSNIVGGRDVAKSLRARQGEVPVEETLPDLLVRKMEANQTEVLTPEQKAKVTEQYEELQSAKKDYEEKVAARESAEAEQVVRKMKADKPKVKKEHTDYVKEREQILSSIKEKLKKSRSELSAVPLPYVKELIAISPDVAKLVKSLVDEGVDKLSDLVTQLHPLVKDAIPDATEKDVLDIIIGKYKPEKTPKQLSKDELAAKDRMIKIKREIEVELYKDELAQRTLWQKIKDAALEVLNVPRTIMSSADLSAPLRQGLIPTISHPGIASKAFVEMLKQAVSQKRFDRWFYEVRESPEFKVMEDSGLYVADPHNPKLAAKEELFMNNLAQKIPLVGKIVKGSEQAYVGYLNKMRVDLFEQGREMLEAAGKTFEKNKEDFEGLASWINNSTGRGTLGEMGEKASPILNTAFFSPRLIASRINLLNPVYYAKLPKEVRVSALKDMAKFIAFGTTMLTLAKLGGADVEADPRSSDFGKIKVGKTRYDIWGGFAQYVRAATQMFMGEAKSINTGKIRELNGEGAFGENRGDVATRFARGKLAPIPATVVDFMVGRTIIGEEVTVAKEAEKNLLPLIVSDVKDAMKDQGVKALFTTYLPAAFGIGVQTFDAKPPASKTKKKTTRTKKKVNKKK